MLASTFRRPRCAMPEHGLLDPGLGRLVQDGVEQGDGRLRAFETEALLAHVAGVQEALEGLGGVQALEDVTLLLGRTRAGRRPRRGAGSIASRPDPRCACTRCRWSGSRRRARCRGAARGAARLPAEPLDDKAPVEVEDREAVGQRVELGVKGRGRRPERVEVGDEVAADPVHVDELLHLGLLDKPAVPAVARADAG